MLTLLLAGLLLTSCVNVPIGDTSSQGDASETVLVPPSPPESQTISEQSVPTYSEVLSSEESSASEASAEESSEEPAIEYEIDITPYLEYLYPENETEYLLLVNYDSRLTDKYAPNDLVVTEWTRGDRDGQKLRKSCAMALDAFLKAAKVNGVTDVTVTSAYRSYSYQKWLFGYYVDLHQSKFSTREECEKYVMTFSCREGCSEHQTGLALDMHNLPAADVKFADTEAYKWLSQNAHRFGFVLRFPKDKEDITGIDFEPWHYRFVGVPAATYMYENNLCLEEYVKTILSKN